ncbi:hypothetical protein [Vreelandella nigrificans]|nr:hypothetical protein [Halomonas nigrificans]
MVMSTVLARMVVASASSMARDIALIDTALIDTALIDTALI